jgi:hypothetical protein
MSVEKDSLYYCLTKDGWVVIEDDEALVTGWLRLYRQAIYRGSPFGCTSRQWHLMKTNAACGSDEVELLEKQFPKPEPRKELSPESLRALLS